ncbi:MAG: phosphoribosyl-AMP cyclohydrolase [Candidatus Nanopelagicaceae bacterium]|jgi:phosphoribosyl-AMP cyclohydrolase
METSAVDLNQLFKDEQSLIAAILQDVSTKEVLMLGWMNRESLELTLSTRKATFWSRSRNAIWVKGETSGNFQEVNSISLDCDRDAILIQVKRHGPVCHTGEISCFSEPLIQ